MNLGDMVIARTGDGEQEGRIVGRTLEVRQGIEDSQGLLGRQPPR